MAITPRILYGLHERFVLFPYERGARKSKLVLRCTALRTFCYDGLTGGARGVSGKEPIIIGAPLVLGELLDGEVSNNVFVPVICSGRELNALKNKGANWAIRNHRAQLFAERSVRFETGTKAVFGTYTAYYSFAVLLELTKECPDETNPRTGVPPG